MIVAQLTSLNIIPITEEHGKILYYTSDVAHRDKDGDYQIYSRANDAIRYRGELLNLPTIEGAAVSVLQTHSRSLLMLASHQNASHESIEETVLVQQLDNKDNVATIELEGIQLSSFIWLSNMLFVVVLLQSQM